MWKDQLTELFPVISSAHCGQEGTCRLGLPFYRWDCAEADASRLHCGMHRMIRMGPASWHVRVRMRCEGFRVSGECGRIGFRL